MVWGEARVASPFFILKSLAGRLGFEPR
jgi:hypothetical protein